MEDTANSTAPIPISTWGITLVLDYWARGEPSIRDYEVLVDPYDDEEEEDDA